MIAWIHSRKTLSLWSSPDLQSPQQQSVVGTPASALSWQGAGSTSESFQAVSSPQVIQGRGVTIRLPGSRLAGASPAPGGNLVQCIDALPPLGDCRLLATASRHQVPVTGACTAYKDTSALHPQAVICGPYRWLWELGRLRGASLQALKDRASHRQRLPRSAAGPCLTAWPPHLRPSVPGVLSSIPLPWPWLVHSSPCPCLLHPLACHARLLPALTSQRPCCQDAKCRFSLEQG